MKTSIREKKEEDKEEKESKQLFGVHQFGMGMNNMLPPSQPFATTGGMGGLGGSQMGGSGLGMGPGGGMGGGLGGGFQTAMPPQSGGGLGGLGGGMGF